MGSYLDPYNVGPIEITAGGAYGLQVSMPLLDLVGYAVAPDLIPATTDVWYVDLNGVLYDLTFIRDPSGGPSPYVRNRSFVGLREATTARGSIPTARGVSPALPRPPARLPPIRTP